jgi:hydroxymethylglutaryl-CoA reductase (NADPH)
MVIPVHVQNMMARVRQIFSSPDTAPHLGPTQTSPRPFRGGRRVTEARRRQLLDALAAPEAVRQALEPREPIEAFASNVENAIGTVSLPLGVIGPLRINGLHANGDFAVPLATTEAALVASYHRGAEAATAAGGISAALLSEGLLRTPAFVFDDLLSAGRFVDWVITHAEALVATAEATTRHGRLTEIEPVIDSTVVFLLCRYTTGDAAGQNMVTIATDELARKAAAEAPVRPLRWYVEGNFSGDKKASALGTLTGRGRKVTASTVLPRRVVERILRTTPEEMLAYGRIAALGAQLSGQFGAQAHYANALAALYIATGQDAACVAESAVGFTRMEARGEDLFCSVTLPNIIVGTVGGGTGLPAQAACLALLGLRGAGHASALAEVAAATCLCGEISIVAAMAAGHFTGAHARLARAR